MLKKIIKKLIGKPKDTMSFKAGFDLTNLPIVTFHQGNNRFNFLLDTGSNKCVINKAILDQIKHTKVESNDTLIGMEGNKVSVDKCVITLYFNDRGYTFEYLVNDLSQAFDSIRMETGVKLHGIIGSEFFNQFKYVLDFAELIAYSKL